MRLYSREKHSHLISLGHMAYSYWAKRRALYSAFLFTIVFHALQHSPNLRISNKRRLVSMSTPHPYHLMWHPPTSWKLGSTIVHLSPDTIQVAPCRGMRAIVSNLMCQLQSLITSDTFILWIETKNLAYPLRSHNQNTNHKHPHSDSESKLRILLTIYPHIIKTLITNTQIQTLISN